MRPMRRLLLVALSAVLASCAGDSRKLEVKQFVLRDATSDFNEDPMIRGEKTRRLFGAIGVREQSQRLGQYYTVLWRDEAGGAPVEVVFEYQQGATGSRIKRSVQKFAPDASSGKAEFNVTGDNYTKGGKVLGWKVSLVRGGQVLDSRKSYLWQ